MIYSLEDDYLYCYTLMIRMLGLLALDVNLINEYSMSDLLLRRPSLDIDEYLSNPLSDFDEPISKEVSRYIVDGLNIRTVYYRYHLLREMYENANA